MKSVIHVEGLPLPSSGENEVIEIIHVQQQNPLLLLFFFKGRGHFGEVWLADYHISSLLEGDCPALSVAVKMLHGKCKSLQQHVKISKQI